MVVFPSADTELNSLFKKSSDKEELCQRLREQLDSLEKETASKLSEMDSFNNQLKVQACSSLKLWLGVFVCFQL